MQNKLYYRIGIFTAAALLLLVGSLFFLGIADEFEERIYFTTTFSESVQGLTKGAEVKYKGVPIGRVERISIVPGEKLIRVDMSVDPNVFHGFKYIKDKDTRLEQIRQFWLKECQNGLCCYLELAGVTGQRYVEMDYVAKDRQRKNPLPEIKDPNTIYIASVPGTFSNIIDSVAVSLNNIVKVDFEKISRELDENLTAISELLNAPEVKETIKRVENIAGNIENLSSALAKGMSASELKKFSENLNNNLESLNKLTGELQKKLADVDAGKLAGQLDATMSSMQNLMDSLQNDKADLYRSLQKINLLVSNLNELVELIKQDPSALIRGRKPANINLEQ